MSDKIYKQYTVSFYGKQYTSKPQGKEAAQISNKLSTTSLTYDFLAKHVGEKGCSFAPGVFDGCRRTEHYTGQQLFAIDIDDGADFNTIKERADKYQLPVLFAYKSFSWTEAHEKFHLVFAMSDFITDAAYATTILKMLMTVFEECDNHCSDLARFFYGSNKGLLFLADEPQELSFRELVLAVNCYYFDKYGESHYTKYLKQFYNSIGVETKKKVPVASITPDLNTPANNRRRTTKVDFSTLKSRCKLYRDFADGKEYYYYSTLFHIASNMVNMDKGKEQFLKILNSPQNEHCLSYHESYRNWKPILNTIIDMNYQPMSCRNCPHVETCPHYKNMILTVDAGKCGIRPLYKKEYVTIEEAEKSLADHFKAAVENEAEGIKLIKAQTGLGKTNTYLHYLKQTNQSFIIAAPTHKLIRELYQKAKSIGITNIVCMPEIPELSPQLKNELMHFYNIGAGKISIKHLKNHYNTMKPSNEDFPKLNDYFTKMDKTMKSNGHILMTHERFLYLRADSPLLENRKVIIDEDILSTAFATITVNTEDIKRAIKMEFFNNDKSNYRLQQILSGAMYQKYRSRAGIFFMEELELPDQLNELQTNILDLLNAKVLIKKDDQVTFIKSKEFPTRNIIIMSATLNSDLYRWLLGNTPIYTYECKQASYKGKLIQYTNSSYSRKKLTLDANHSDLQNDVRQMIADGAVITFKCCEEAFHTTYHFGAVEGLNVLEGKNISVVGLPNMDESVYKLYGMLLGVDPYAESWKYRKIQHDGYEFYLNTFYNDRLRTIQLWMIESHLEQAVGRARLLRYDCTVKVFARFPIDQAEIQ